MYTLEAWGTEDSRGVGVNLQEAWRGIGGTEDSEEVVVSVHVRSVGITSISGGVISFLYSGGARGYFTLRGFDG